ncbi:MAG: hypothetical protein SFV32_03150 [Opitutaceae bacterium]|nr:hypothetical protein [Opitutaceae bacterium]
MAEQPADKPPSIEARQLAERFLSAVRGGHVDELVGCMTEDARLITDGGGVVRAAGRPILGAGRIARFFVGVRRWASENRRLVPTLVNGRHGALEYMDGILVNAISFEFEGSRISAIYVVRNPRKLRHLGGPQALSSSDS